MIVANETNKRIYLFKNNNYVDRYLQTANLVKTKAYMFLNLLNLKKS